MRTLALIFTTLTAWSHDMWIEPATFAPQPGSIVAVKLRVGQDLIGWTEFLHGKVSVEIASI